MPVAHWHEQIGDPTIADSILDRLIHNAYRIDCSGPFRTRTLERAALVTVVADLEEVAAFGIF